MLESMMYMKTNDPDEQTERLKRRNKSLPLPLSPLKGKRKQTFEPVSMGYIG